MHTTDFERSNWNIMLLLLPEKWNDGTCSCLMRLPPFCMSADISGTPPGSSRRCTFHQFQFSSCAPEHQFSLISAEEEKI